MQYGAFEELRTTLDGMGLYFIIPLST